MKTEPIKSTKLTNDELWEKAATNEPITRQDLGINVVVSVKKKEPSFLNKLINKFFTKIVNWLKGEDLDK